MELAGELNGAPDELDPIEEADEARALTDEARQVAWTTALGASSAAAYEAWTRSLPNDVSVGEVVAQPEDIRRFDAATFSWKGGSNAVDNPTVRVERLVDGEWKTFADQSGEVQTMVKFPAGVNGFFDTYTGAQEWVWTANFEAFNAFPAGIGSTPVGTYRFVEGDHREGFMPATYEITSEEFEVSAWDGLEVRDLRREEDGSVSFEVAPIAYPESYESVFPYVTHHMRNEADRGELIAEDIKSWCDTCSFRPWATTTEVASATVTVVRANGSRELGPRDLHRWSVGGPGEPQSG